MPEWLTKLFVYVLIAIAAFVGYWVFLKFCQWVNRAQVKKWENALDDSAKSLEVQQAILAEVKAVRELLEKR